MASKKKSRKKPAKTKKPSAANKKPTSKAKKKSGAASRKSGANKGIDYGVLKGTVAGGEREAEATTPHYQIKVKAEEDGKTITWRCPVNVKSGDGSEVLFFVDSDLLKQSTERKALAAMWKKKLKALDALADGFTALPDHEPGIALDYVREEYVAPEEMTHLPSDGPGANDDVQDTVEMYITRAKDQRGTIHVFGERFGSGAGSGVHDIHMNQGNAGKWKKDNGIYQDGGIVITFPSGRHVAMLFAFQTQSWNTDEHGNATRQG